MRFLKEYTIIILIIIFVILVEIITDDITKKSLDEINIKLDNLQSIIGKENDEKMMNDLLQAWKNREDKLSFYLEHNELEKISTLVINLKSNIQNDDYGKINEEIDEIKFMLEHIKNKQKLELKNIF